MFDVFSSELFEENIEWFYNINWGLDNSIFDLIMPLISTLGSVYGWTIFCIVIYIFGDKFGKKVALLALIALFVTNIIVIFLKYVVAEPRPFLTLPNVDLLVPVDGQSFPSGHTASSFAAATVIGLKYHVKSKGRLYWLVYPLFIFAFLVGISRIYVGVHYPYDVIIGALLGTICALTALKYENKLLNNKIAHFFY
ncbi:phosphatase PAP2 family protein [Methanobacterium sp. CWC-01]|uniref:phosphatase PAP2 family protein n=1 Tax=Methanobacterium aridiramus TaxID=2584467 RepID=UPI0025752B9A|nr:phosphatase PAP2 family protein [Methanobacterium sp. CWC-01]WJI10480.1 phosphatase PAP2 family protein [Methanobacterium sp. CWC-01]